MKISRSISKASIGAFTATLLMSFFLVAVPQSFASPIASDTFTRSNQSHWGTASDGNAWGADASSSSNFSINSNTGVVSGTSGLLYGTLGSSSANEQASVTAKTTSFASNTDFDVLLRYTNNNNWYKAYLDGSNLVIRRMQSGTNTQLASVAFTASTNTLYTIKFQIVGEMLAAKAWPASGSEPSAWSVAADDSNFASGQVGIGVNNGSGGTLTFTSFTASTVNAPSTPSAPSGATSITTDTYQRANQAQWGNSTPSNNYWSKDADTNTAFSISSNSGKVGKIGGIVNAVPNTSNIDDQEAVTIGAATSYSNTDFGVLLRYVDSNNWYKAYLDGSSLIIRKDVAGSNTVVATTTFNASPGTQYAVRFRAVGQTLYAKAWDASTTEPSSWSIQNNDLQNVSGVPGLGISNTGTSTVLFTYYAAYHFALPSTLASDTFSRSNQSTWGTASDGNSWLSDAGSGSNFSIGSNKGIVSGTSSSILNGVLGEGAVNESVLAQASTSSFSGTDFGVLLHYSSSNNWYKAYLDGSNLVIRKMINGTNTQIATATFAASANTNYSIRFQYNGVTLSARAWATGSTEPSTWMDNVNDSDLAAGYTGVGIANSGGNTVSYTSFTASSFAFSE